MVCGHELAHLSAQGRQRHVNGCLDRASRRRAGAARPVTAAAEPEGRKRRPNVAPTSPQRRQRASAKLPAAEEEASRNLIQHNVGKRIKCDAPPARGRSRLRRVERARPGRPACRPPPGAAALTP